MEQSNNIAQQLLKLGYNGVTLSDLYKKFKCEELTIKNFDESFKQFVEDVRKEYIEEYGKPPDKYYVVNYLIHGIGRRYVTWRGGFLGLRKVERYLKVSQGYLEYLAVDVKDVNFKNFTKEIIPSKCDKDIDNVAKVKGGEDSLYILYPECLYDDSINGSFVLCYKVDKNTYIQLNSWNKENCNE